MSDIEFVEENTEVKEKNNKTYTAITYIKSEDLRDFNRYLTSKNKNYGMLLGGIAILIFGIWGLVTEKSENLIINIIFCLLGILAVLYVFVFAKKILEKRIQKLELKDVPPVEVVISDDGILYQYVEEKTTEDLLPFGWNLVRYVVVCEKHIYVHMVDYRTILLIVKSDIENTEFLTYFENRMKEENKWILK